MGQHADSWKWVLSRHDIGNYNDNGCLLLELCSEQQLVITHIIFQQKDTLKTTWMYSWSKHWHLIDYVLVHKCDLKNIIYTKVMVSAECHTDHCLVCCKLRLDFKSNLKKGGPPKKKFSWNTLGSTEECYSTDIWGDSGVYHQEEQKMVQQEQPRDSGTTWKEEIIQVSPPG